MMTTINDIENLLPQTQCEDCGYHGCKPYAEAICQGERIDLCLPGGVDVLQQLAQLTQQNAEPMIISMQQRQKGDQLAVIREDECIGCTKCIPACPVDAIIGAKQQMHTVLTDACNGCGLCLTPCPVDCIELIDIATRNTEQKRALAQQNKQRFIKHTTRTTRDKKEKRERHLAAKHNQNPKQSIAERQKAIADAVKRAQRKHHE